MAHDAVGTEREDEQAMQEVHSLDADVIPLRTKHRRGTIITQPPLHTSLALAL